MFSLGGGGLDSPVESRFINLPQLNAQEVVDALSKWDGMEDTIALFNDLLKENGMSSYPQTEGLDVQSGIERKKIKAV
jgi:hypothetical protein